MSSRIALLGLSGVGKSTLIAKLRIHASLIHLQASALIKAEQLHRSGQPESSEMLRIGEVIDNQQLLIAAFRREATATSLPIIFDGHSIIDGRDGIVEIPSTVFLGLGFRAICFLSADPGVIAERRQSDTTRARPMRDVGTLAAHQARAQAVAQRIAADIQCPFLSVDDKNLGRLLQLLKQT